MRWRIFAPNGEAIAATRYAIDAARIAIAAGIGARVANGTRFVLTVDAGTLDDGCLTVADKMIAGVRMMSAESRLRAG